MMVTFAAGLDYAAAAQLISQSEHLAREFHSHAVTVRYTAGQAGFDVIPAAVILLSK
jgi:hypothetical protein